jgi:RNA polymerase sigma-70 factor (ECF subfamily)
LTGPGGHDVTRLLKAWSAGDAGALKQLFPLVYDELRALAGAQLKGERVDHTLQPTALVHEAFLRLLPRKDASVEDRVQFMAVASQAIRRVLVDHGRARAAAKRGGDRVRVTLTGAISSEPEPEIDILALDRGLKRLGEADAVDQQVVELRFFGGLSDAEAAAVLGISARTVRRRWAYSRAWLYRELQSGSASAP